MRAAKDVGFIRLTDFVEPELFTSAFELANQFFSLPSSVKKSVATQSYEAINPNVYRGYFPPLPQTDSLKEGFEIGPGTSLVTDNPLYEPNPYPAELPKQWRERMESYYQQMQLLGMSLLSAFEQALMLPKGRLTDRFENGVSTLRLIHYPQGSNDQATALEQEGDVAFSTPAHVDSGILTLLLQDETGGLQARHSNGDWLDIDPIPGTLVMNLGALLETLTGGAVKATEHRVKMPSRSRYSIPFFMEPAANAPITELATGENPLSLANYQAYLIKQMADFVEYHALIGRLANEA